MVPQALWSAALMAYDRCFAKGKRFGLTADDVRNLPLEGQVMKFHNWIVDERNQLARHPADPYDVARVGAVLSGPSGGQDERRVEGITVLSASHILVDGAGVRQLGALASELAKQTAEKAQKQESAVLADAQKISLDKLYALPPLPVGAPDDDRRRRPGGIRHLVRGPAGAERPADGPASKRRRQLEKRVAHPPPADVSFGLADFLAVLNWAAGG